MYDEIENTFDDITSEDSTKINKEDETRCIKCTYM